MTGGGRVLSDAPTTYALALQWALLPDAAQRQRAGQRLADLVRTAGFRISTGFVGTPLMTDALTDAGEPELAYRLLLQTGCPSWLYSVTMGATTVWERWDSMLPDGSINPGEMTSFNHYALGAVADWLHRRVAGLAPAAPGYRELRGAPAARTARSPRRRRRHLTPYGEAAVSWQRARRAAHARGDRAGRRHGDRARARRGRAGRGAARRRTSGRSPTRCRGRSRCPPTPTIRELMDHEPTLGRRSSPRRVRPGVVADEAELAARLARYLDAPASQTGRRGHRRRLRARAPRPTAAPGRPNCPCLVNRIQYPRPLRRHPCMRSPVPQDNSLAARLAVGRGSLSGACSAGSLGSSDATARAARSRCPSWSTTAEDDRQDRRAARQGLHREEPGHHRQGRDPAAGRRGRQPGQDPAVHRRHDRRVHVQLRLAVPGARPAEEPRAAGRPAVGRAARRELQDDRDRRRQGLRRAVRQRSWPARSCTTRPSTPSSACRCRRPGPSSWRTTPRSRRPGSTRSIQTYQDTWTSQLFVLGDFHNVAAAEPDFAEKYTKNQAKYATVAGRDQGLPAPAGGARRRLLQQGLRLGQVRPTG